MRLSSLFSCVPTCQGCPLSFCIYQHTELSRSSCCCCSFGVHVINFIRYLLLLTAKFVLGFIVYDRSHVSSITDNRGPFHGSDLCGLAVPCCSSQPAEQLPSWPQGAPSLGELQSGGAHGLWELQLGGDPGFGSPPPAGSPGMELWVSLATEAAAAGHCTASPFQRQNTPSWREETADTRRKS